MQCHQDAADLKHFAGAARSTEAVRSCYRVPFGGSCEASPIFGDRPIGETTDDADRTASRCNERPPVIEKPFVPPM